MNTNQISGIGLITAAGVGCEENYRNFTLRSPGICTVTRFELPSAKVKTNFAGLIKAMPDESLPPELLPLLNSDDLAQDYVKAAVYVTAEAIKDAGAAEKIKSDPRRTGLIVASSLGNFLNVSELVKDYFMKELYKITSLIHGMNSYLPSRIGSIFGVAGPCYFVSSSCTSSLNAILQADTLIKSGIVDRMIVCAVDVCLETGTFHLWNKIRVLSHRNDSPQTACRPYCKTRDGIVVSEAAGCFVIEKADTATARGHALIKGIGMANGASDFLKPSPELLEAAIREALAAAQTPSDKIDFIAGSASGSPHCDHMESEAICRIFGARAGEIPLFPYKSFLGSTFGTQALTEGALAIKTMNDNLVPEPLNIFERDERVNANAYYKASDYSSYRINNTLFVNYGFAGNHMAVVLAKCR
ncbi:MAG: hypothetical protein CVV41_03650 [Candidatus Riflebacteria bacterium HGW-Riflebacteria-1]|jgi:3-oxoacyl-[acyl-carrier-protein] synthase II|nr:MAG: hypothetical protein CVV41_03650 [Candidatus Riflebacteria bacterium HGW-Riflebacteria-1]